MSLSGITTNKTYLIVILGIAAGFSLGVYLLSANWVYRLGFPLDDAWIHQTYARNLASDGSWAFLPGQPSAGSTAPGWSFLLALGHGLNLGPYLWTFLLGWLILWGLALAGAFGFRLLQPKRAELGIWIGLLIIFEWHLTWAAGSGMETLLQALIALTIILWVIRLELQYREMNSIGWWHWLCLGCGIGLCVWIRPDGITLLGVVGFFLLLSPKTVKEKLMAALLISSGLILVVVPYLYFNQVLAGDYWPNTFFAKQAEYAVLREYPYWRRFINLSQQPITGVGIVLLPGFIWFTWTAVKRRNWASAAGAIWVVGYLAVYAWRLPVTYQHGRYIMPIMPAYCLFGFTGLVQILALKFPSAWGRIVTRSVPLIASILLIAFWILGGNAFAQDVAVIESEMVETANWISINTEQDSLIAAHDIGALGYFSGREILDLAGLISPEVIPFIRDETALGNHIDKSGAGYLMTFPKWYTELTSNLRLIYESDGQFSPALGGENMSVFLWKQD